MVEEAVVEHAGVRIGRKFQAAIAARNDHGKEAVGFDEGPNRGRQVGAPMRDVPVIQHRAQLLAGALDESLFGGRQLRRLGRHELLPVRASGEQFTVPPNGAGVQSLALGGGHGRQQLQVFAQEWAGQQAQAQGPQVQEQQQRERHRQREFPPQRRSAGYVVGAHEQREYAGADREAHTPVRQDQEHAQE
jgi:hypothetical protein